MLSKVDKNTDGVIEWLEFLDMMQLVKKNGNNFGEALTQGGQAANVITSASGAKVSYLREEVSMIARAITNTCKDDTLVQERLPIDPENDDLFHACSDGMVLVHLMKHIDEDSIDMRTVNKGSNMNIYQVRENLDMALSAAATRIKMVGVGAQSFLDKNPQIILGVLWQIVLIISTKKIVLKDVPEIIRLAEGDEEMKDLLKLPAEKILIRWINFHLENAGQEQRVTNLGKDL